MLHHLMTFTRFVHLSESDASNLPKYILNYAKFSNLGSPVVILSIKFKQVICNLPVCPKRTHILWLPKLTFSYENEGTMNKDVSCLIYNLTKTPKELQ